MIIRVVGRVLSDPQWYPLLDAIVTTVEHAEGQHSFDIAQYKSIVESAWLLSKNRDRMLIAELIKSSIKLANQSTPSDAVTLEVNDRAPVCGEAHDANCVRVHPLGALPILMQPFYLIVEDETSDGSFILWMARMLGHDALLRAYRTGRFAFRHAGGKGQMEKSASALTYGVWPRPNQPIRSLKLRAAAMLDSDAAFPGHAPNGHVATALEQHVAFVHVLERRTIENYVPSKYFRKRLAADGQISTAEAFFRMSEEQQCFFSMRHGFQDKAKAAMSQPAFLSDLERDQRERDHFRTVNAGDWLTLSEGFGTRLAAVFTDPAYRCQPNERCQLAKSARAEMTSLLSKIIRHL